MGKNALGCLVFTFIASMILICVGGVLLSQAPEKATRAATVAALQPQSATLIGQADPGEMVVVAGQVDPQVAALEQGLAMYAVEKYVKETRRDSKGRTRTSYEWDHERSVTPPFALIASDGSVPIVNQSYELDTPRYDEQGESEEGALRFEGFKPGDEVLVVGTAAQGGIEAETVFGGTQEEYVAALQSRATSERRIGMGLLACGVLPLLVVPVAGFVLWRRGRSASASIGVDTTGATVPSMTFGGGEVTPTPVPAQRACPNCGAPLPENATFCGGCGSRVDLPPAGSPV